jgi:hypothetical protein
MKSIILNNFSKVTWHINSACVNSHSFWLCKSTISKSIGNDLLNVNIHTTYKFNFLIKSMIIRAWLKVNQKETNVQKL